jgi:hypothetical protein
LSIGFKYLGFYLKSGVQKAIDWRWLLTKVESKIQQWSYRWLSLGGRYILCKSVLESQPIYWLSLAAIPTSILHKLRSILYNFLWSGNREKKSYHLCRWELLARPKKRGGWGLHNIFSFGKALAASTLWRAISKPGIWHKVLKGKYFPHSTLSNWLRSTTFHYHSASRIWSSLMKSVHLITNWIGWKPGSGLEVSLGRDNILGLGPGSYLSTNLIEALKQKNISLLAQVWYHQGQTSFYPIGKIVVSWDW